MQLNSPDNATHARGLLLDHSAEQQKTEKTEYAEKSRPEQTDKSRDRIGEDGDLRHRDADTDTQTHSAQLGPHFLT